MTFEIGGVAVSVIAGSLEITDEIEARSTASFTVLDEAGTASYEQNEYVEIYDGATLVYAGFIDNSTERKLPGSSVLLHEIVCKDMHYLADKRIIAEGYANQTAAYIVNDIITQYLDDEGVTAGTIQTGPTVIEAIFNYIPITQALDSLAEKAGFIWYIDYDKALYFMARSTVTAPFTLTGDKALSNSVRVTHHNPQYRNTQYVRGGKDITDELTESRIGDGVLTAFTMNFPLAKVPTITLNAGAQTVGIRGIDTGKDWYWSKGSNIISQDDAGTILVSTDTLTVVYYGEFDVIVKTLNEAEITRLQTLETSSGLVEDVASETNSTTREAAFEIANAKLERFASVGTKVKFRTIESGLFAGQLLTINLPEHDIDDDFLIESVVTREQQNTLFYDVIATKGTQYVSWAKLLDNLIAKNGAFVVRENIAEDEVLITLKTFSKTWTESEVPNIFTENYPSDTLQPSANTHPSFEIDERVLYMEMIDGSDVVIFRQEIIKQTGTATLNSINYIAPYQGIGSVAKVVWYGGSTATASNGTGTKVDEQAYVHDKVTTEALQIDKTDTKWV